MNKSNILRGIILTGLLFAPGLAFAETNILQNSGFEDWEWAPIPAAMGKQARGVLARNEKLSFEYRGPLYHRLKDFYDSTGRMIEGEEAFQGRSMLLENNMQDGQWFIVGYHAGYSHLLHADCTYQYEIQLKGKGIFMFKAFVYGWDPASGKQKALGSPDMIKVEVTEKWKKYTGNFALPKYPGCKIEEPVTAAMVLFKGSAIYVDNFIISQSDPAPVK